MIAASFFFSIMSLLVKIAGERLPSAEIVLARGLVSLVLSYLLLRRRRISPWGNRRGLLALRGVFGFGGLYCFYYAITHLPFAEATVLQYTSPVFTALLAALLLREGLGGRLLASLAFSLVGVVLIAKPALIFGTPSELGSVAVMVALGGAISSAFAYVVVRRLRKTEDPLVVVFYFPLVAVPLTIPAVWDVFLWPTPLEWLVLLGVGVTTQIAQVYMTRGLNLETAGKATSVGYIQVVFAAILGASFFGEIPDFLSIGGAALVVVGTLAVSYRRARPPSESGARSS